MKKVLLSIMIICFFTFNVYAGGELFINGDIRACPLLFEPNYRIMGVDIGTTLIMGYYSQLYTIGLKTSFDYTFYETIDESQITTDPLQGTWLHTRVLVDQAYRFTPSVKAEWGAGFIWLNNTIAFDSAAMRTIDFYGLSFDFNLKLFFPGQFLIFEILNRIDLLYAFNPDLEFDTMAPHYYGGVRISFDFGIKWFLVYLEAKGHYWNYADSDQRISTGIASSGIGISLRPPSIKTGKNESLLLDTDPLHTQEKADTLADHTSAQTGGDTITEEKEKLHPDVEKLNTISADEKVQFHSIIFVKYTDELIPASYPVLDQINSVLQQRKDLKLTISAYAEYQENPVAEFQLCTDRAKKIKEYLVKGGIEEYRLKVSSIGQIVSLTNQKTGPTVILKKIDHES
jgi:outer membrane protein OmpA-like peptidoglycan-associated protein